MRATIKSIALASGLAAIGVGASASADLIAQIDLPGVPVSITDGQRLPVNDRTVNTESLQADARRRQEQRLAEIAQLNASTTSRTEEVDTRTADAPVHERVRRMQQQIIAQTSNAERQGQTGTSVEVQPGVNRLVQVSRGHPNRLVMPFENPRIRTTSSDAEITAHGPVIYVATNSERPVTLFVSPDDDERVAVSLTLLPKAIPPQELNIKISGEYAHTFRFARPTAQRWEERTPYVHTLVQLFEAIAKQQLPQGYSIRDPHPTDPLTCWADEYVTFELGQVLEGHNIEVQVLIAHNHGDRPVEIIGSLCAGERVLAAAEWPRSMLEPGDKTEVYVARQRLDEAEVRASRPSLIDRRH